jgi:tetratricopeptide (TPR) repeat protein
MFWKILLLVIAGLILILGIIKAWQEAKRQKPGRNAKRDITIAVLLACLVGIYPLIQLLQPSEIKENLKPIVESQKRIEQKLDSLGRQPGEPVPYKDGIPQSENLNLRKLFDEGQKHLNNYEYDKGIKAFRAALALQDLKPSEAAALLIHIGTAQYEQSKWDEAEGSYKEALDWAEKGNDEWGQAAALGNLGLVYQDKGQWDKAIEFYNKSLKIKEKIGDEHGMTQTYGNLGNVYQLKGEWDKAIEFYNKSLKIKEKIGDERGMAQTKGNIAILYKMQGKKAEAKKIFEEILKIFEKMGDRPNAEIVRKHLEDL